eukprot:6327090-Prymnesium_polylepis.1
MPSDASDEGSQCKSSSVVSARTAWRGRDEATAPSEAAKHRQASSSKSALEKLRQEDANRPSAATSSHSVMQWRSSSLRLWMLTNSSGASIDRRMVAGGKADGRRRAAGRSADGRSRKFEIVHSRDAHIFGRIL